MNRAQQRAAWQARHRGSSAAPPSPAPESRAPDIRFEIGEIVLHGLPRLNRHDVAEGVHVALSESLVSDGLPAHFTGLNRVRQLQGGRIPVGPGAGAVAVGRRIAGAILGVSSP